MIKYLSYLSNLGDQIFIKIRVINAAEGILKLISSIC